MSGDVNVKYFYELTCTMKNLTLVHNECHDRTPHEGYEVDLQQILLPIPEDSDKSASTEATNNCTYPDASETNEGSKSKKISFRLKVKRLSCFRPFQYNK